MLDGAGNQVVAAVEVGKGRSLQGRVVRFGAAAGEDHLARPAVQDLRHGIAGGIEGMASLASPAVDARRVSRRCTPIGQHGGQHVRVYRRGGGVVQVDG